jgi:hypothetical protein
MSSTAQPDGCHNLKGWKEIGDFLRVHPRTVQRWIERGIAVPVHRIQCGHSSIVYGTPGELDTWMHSAEGQAARRGEADEQKCRNIDGVESAACQPSTAAAAEPVRAGPSVGLTAAPDTAAAPQPPQRDRRLVPISLAVMAVVALLAVGVSGLRGGDRTERSGANKVAPPASGPFFELRLVFADGTVGRLGMTAGTPATIMVGGRRLLLSGALLNGVVRLHIAEVDGDNNVLTELVTADLGLGDIVRLPDTVNVKSIQWAHAKQ